MEPAKASYIPHSCSNSGCLYNAGELQRQDQIGNPGERGVPPFRGFDEDGYHIFDCKYVPGSNELTGRSIDQMHAHWMVSSNSEIEGMGVLGSHWTRFKDGIVAAFYQSCSLVDNTFRALAYLLAIILFHIGLYVGMKTCCRRLGKNICFIANNIKNVVYYAIRMLPIIGYYLAVALCKIGRKLRSTEDQIVQVPTTPIAREGALFEDESGQQYYMKKDGTKLKVIDQSAESFNSRNPVTNNDDVEPAEMIDLTSTNSRPPHVIHNFEK